MIFKRSTDKYGATDAPVTPYQRAAQVWDDRMGAARVQAKNWRLAALVSLGLSFVLTVGLLWLSTRSTVTPYVVEIHDTGAVRAVGPADGVYTPDDAQIAYHLATFIRNTGNSFSLTLRCAASTYMFTRITATTAMTAATISSLVLPGGTGPGPDGETGTCVISGVPAGERSGWTAGPATPPAEP